MTPRRRCHDTTYISQNMADRVYMYTKSIHVHVHVCVHTLYMIVLTLQNSCALRYIYVVWRVLVNVSMVLGSESRALLGYNVACGTENCCGSPSALPEV